MKLGYKTSWALVALLMIVGISANATRSGKSAWAKTADSDSVAEKTFLVRQADCIGIPEPFVRWVDCHEFDSLVRRAAESEQLEQRCQLLTRAVSLYKGRFLEGCFLDWWAWP